MRPIQAVRTVPLPRSNIVQVFIRVNGALEARYLNGQGRTWHRSESGELSAAMLPEAVRSLGRLIELHPQPKGPHSWPPGTCPLC